MKTKQVIFVTGAFVGNNCWDGWKDYFKSKGHSCSAPPWPCKNASPPELRARWPNDPCLTALTLSEVIESYASTAKKLPEKPVVIGHSLGGLVTQILLNRDLCAAGVAIHPEAPQGILPYEFSFFKAAWKSLGLFTSMKKTYLMSFKDWQYAFVNGMPPAEQKMAYENYTIPESKRVIRGGLTGAASVDFTKPHAPLLIVSGSTDHIVPAHLNKRNFGRYKDNKSVTEYLELPGRNHFVLGQPTWKEDADYILRWIEAL